MPGRGRKQDDFNAEIEAHIQIEAERLRDSGMSREEAEAAARRSFGNATRAMESFYESSRWSWWDGLKLDVTFSLRVLRRSPGFTITAILLLAAGIGANTAVLSYVDAIFFRKPPVHEPERLVGIYGTRDDRVGEQNISWRDYTYYRDRATSFSGLAAFNWIWAWMSDGENSRELIAGTASDNLFEVMEVKPALGRFFSAEENAARQPVAVLGYELWKGRFGGDPGVLGRIVRLNRTAYTVVGVAPAEIGSIQNSTFDLWLPALTAAAGREEGQYDLVGRMKPGISSAEAEVSTLAATLAAEATGTRERKGAATAALMGLRPRERRAAQSSAFLLQGIAACLLLIACANLAGLMLTRSLRRRREIALRMAIGARPSALVRQLVLETCLLAGAGCAAGLLAAIFAKEVIPAYSSYNLPGLRLSLSPMVIASGILISFLTPLLFGVGPAILAIRGCSPESLKANAAAAHGWSGSRSPLRSGLVSAQIAIAVALLVCAGLLLESLHAVLGRSTFADDRIASFRLRPTRIGYTPERAEKLNREMLRRLSALPGVQSAVLGTNPPTRGWAQTSRVQLPEQPRDAGAILMSSNTVTPGYLATIGIPLVAGREFDERDGPGAPGAAIVNRSLAAAFWPGREPIGRDIVVAGRNYTVVGVAKDVHPSRADEGAFPFVYLAYWQQRQIDSRLFVRVDGNPRSMIPALRRAILEIEPDMHIGQEMTLRDRNEMSFQTEGLLARVLSFSAVMALVFSALGLYGTLSFSVGQRTREIGIRMALGARPAAVIATILRQGAVLIVIGLGAGVGAALAVSRLLTGHVYGITPTHPLTYAAACMAMTVVALLACLTPAYRASRVDPISALRTE